MAWVSWLVGAAGRLYGPVRASSSCRRLAARGRRGGGFGTGRAQGLSNPRHDARLLGRWGLIVRIIPEHILHIVGVTNAPVVWRATVIA